jgi:hypothetical protein
MMLPFQQNDISFAGIGSRKTPLEVQNYMQNIAKEMASRGYILRSGGADGADSAFEIGCDLVKGKKEIYIPWPNFNNKTECTFLPIEEAFKIASKIHPVWHKLKDSHKKLHARNVHQILGKNLLSPVKFVVCWTSDGTAKGGTATAINLAMSYGIPVYNLYNERYENELFSKFK